MRKHYTLRLSEAISVFLFFQLITFQSAFAQTSKTGPISVCYVEVNNNNFANTGCYTLKNGGQQLFDIAVIFAANIHYDATAQKAILFNNNNVSSVLANNITLIKPLQAKGMKVTLSVLGDHQGVGVSNFTSRAAAHDFAQQIADTVNFYGLDGVDFDDEWAEYGLHGQPAANDSSFVMLLSEVRSLMPTKLITFYFYGPASTHLSYNGQTVGQIVNYSWNAMYSTFSVPNVPGLTKSQLAPAAIWIDNTSTATAQNLAQQTVSGGYGVCLFYDLHGTDESAYLSSASYTLNGDSTKLTPGCVQPWPLAVPGNYSLSFNGINQSVNAGTINLNGSALSMEGWVKPAAFKASSPYITSIMGTEVGATNSALLRFGDANISGGNKLQYVLSIGGTQQKLTSKTVFNTGTWYHIAGTYDGASMKIYVNGTLDTSMAASGAVSSNGIFYMGYSWDNTRYFNGQLDELRVWGRALTQTEILANMCAADPAAASLTAYWRLNDGGLTAMDTTGHGHNGNLTGMTTANWSTNVTAACNVVLPIKLVDFSAIVKNMQVNLNWHVAQGSTVNHFDILHSTDGFTFSKIGTVTERNISAYDFIHSSPVAGKNYYTLRLIDNNGQETYSDVKVINYGRSSSVVIYPDPVKTNFNIVFETSWLNKPVKLRLYNSAGQAVYNKQFIKIQLTEKIEINKLPSGIYSLMLQQDGHTTEIKKIVIKN